jgi:hypothetical protein
MGKFADMELELVKPLSRCSQNRAAMTQGQTLAG